MDQNSRPQYYEGEYLAAEDLEAIVRYGRTGDARHALGAHVWGIAIGLDLIERPLAGDDVEVVLTPGVAWDGHGRALVVAAPQRLTPDLFAGFVDDTVPEGVPLEVWLSYRELPASPAPPGFVCPSDTAYGRIVETLRIEVRRPGVVDYHAVSLAGRSIEASSALKAFDASKGALYDESVPQQEFPESGDSPRWPVFVGVVRWKKDAAGAGSIKRTNEDRNASRKRRRYVGAVAETIVAPDGVIRLRDRWRDPNDHDVNFQPPGVAASPAELVWCEGHLRVVGDVRLQPSQSGAGDGMIDFRVPKGGNDGVPMFLRRTLLSGQTPKTTLDAFVGPPPPTAPPGAQTRFTVSTLDASQKPREIMTAVTTVSAGVTQSQVGINRADPDSLLQLHSDNPIQGDIRMFSTAADFEYDGGGDHRFVFKATGGARTEFDGGDVGIGTDPIARLHIAKDSHLNAIFDRVDKNEHLTVVVGSDGSGLRFSDTNDFFIASQAYADRNDNTFGNERVRVKADGSVGIGTATPAGRLHVIGGILRLEDNAKRIDLRTDGSAVDLLSETSDLYIRSFGPNGRNNVIVNSFPTDGNVGIGTATPSVKLDVVGDVSIKGDMELDGDQFVASGFLWTISDRRAKHKITEIEKPLNRLLALQGVSYHWRETARRGRGQGRHLGFIAQDIEAAFPEMVKEAPSGEKAVNLDGLHALAVEAIRELASRCDRLESEVASLRKGAAGGGAGDSSRAPRKRGARTARRKPKKPEKPEEDR